MLAAIANKSPVCWFGMVFAVATTGLCQFVQIAHRICSIWAVPIFSSLTRSLANQ